METIQAVVQWIQNHWAEIGSMLLGVVALANVVVGWTETKKDDNFVKKVKDVLLKIFGKEIPK